MVGEHIHGYTIHVEFEKDSEIGELTDVPRNGFVVSKFGSVCIWPRDVNNELFIERHRHIHFVLGFDGWSNATATDVYINELVQPGNSKMMALRRYSEFVDRQIKILQEKEFPELKVKDSARKRCEAHRRSVQSNKHSD